MRFSAPSRLSLMVAAAVVLAACDSGDTVGPELDAQFNTIPTTIPGAVYTMTNQSDGNAVAVFTRGGDGMLTTAGTYATGGRGNGGDLGNQGSIVLSKDRRYLFVVNAGTHDLSSFSIRPEGLELVDRVPSGGEMPVSVTTDGDLVYVLNGAGAGSIMGFRIGKGGSLVAIPGSSRHLSGAMVTAPAQIAFSRTGDYLAVSEKVTNLIDIYTLNADGTASGPQAQASAGQTPFGLGFGLRNQLVVSEAFGGTPGLASASSYNLDREGNLSVATAALGNTQTAACWAAVTPDGRLAYTANTPSNTISGYRIAADGTLSLVDPDDGITGTSNPGDLPKDLGFSLNGRYLYALNVGTGTVGIFRIGPAGTLTHIGDSDAVLPAGVVNGIAAW